MSGCLGQLDQAHTERPGVRVVEGVEDQLVLLALEGGDEIGGVLGHGWVLSSRSHQASLMRITDAYQLCV